MSGGIGDYSGSTPSIFPGSGDIDEGASPAAPVSTPEGLDALLEGELQDPEFLQLRASKTLNLPPGKISLIELAKIVSKVISGLREALNESEFIDAELSQKFHKNSLQEAQNLLDKYRIIEELVDSWNSAVKGPGNEPSLILQELSDARIEFSNLITTTMGNDASAIQEVNQYIDIYNNPTALQDVADTHFGGDLNAALTFISQQIQQYNTYISGRPNLQAALDEYVALVEEYNATIDEINESIILVNAERSALGLPTTPLLQKTAVPSSDITDYLSYEGQLPLSLPTALTLPAGSTTINRINISPNSGDVGSLPLLQSPGKSPRFSYSEAFELLWLPEALETLAFLSSFNRALDLAEAQRIAEIVLFKELGKDITAPSAFVERSQEVFLDSVGGLGGGIGLAAFAMGLHSRNLEIALSRAILTSVAMNSRMPITGRLFAGLQFTALELLQKSSLLSPLPALRFIASAIGHLGSASPAVRVAISLAITTQVMGVVGGGALRSLVNAKINRLPLFARVRESAALKGVVRAEQGLQNAIETGHPGRIRRGIRMLGNARIRHGRATKLMNTFGLLSVGGLASFTKAVSATMSLSILSVAMAHLGRAIGLPGMVAQIFAQASGVSTVDMLTALTAGSRIMDVLDNPISVLALKQTLVDKLVFSRGMSSVAAGTMINSAVNNIILRGGIHSFSHLRSELHDEFQRAGFSLFHANLLANETVALIRGDVGVNFLNVAFGLNFDKSTIATSVVNSISGMDVGLAGAMLSNAVTRSLMLGGFGSRVRLQSELTAQFQNLGLSFNDAYGMSENMANFIETVGVVIPLTRFPGLSNVLLGNTLLSSLAFGSNIVRDDLINDLQARGLNSFQSEFLADQVTSLAARTFTKPGNLFESTLESAIERAGNSFQTQREFRDRVFNELKAVGFGVNDASFLANSAASNGLDGTEASVTGVSASRLAAIEEASVNSLTQELGLPGGEARAILSGARDRAIAQGPFSSQDLFQSILKEEFSRAVASQTGRSDGHEIFDRAIAELSDSGTIQNLAALTEQIGTSVQGILRPDLGQRAAEEVKNQLLKSLLGGATVDEIADDEKRNPLSVLNQVEKGLEELLKSEEEEDMKATLRKLIQLLQALLTPNAEVGFLLQTLSDSPSTFIGSILGSQQAKGEFLQIPA